MEVKRRFTLSESEKDDEDAELRLLLDKLLPCFCFWQAEKLSCETTTSKVINRHVHT